ncbi:MAG: hypothetical protein JRE29_07155 [Deltaproteobacteria bacterium]|nr:hypothetical protein [Deltaproteobacteria bacterium]
MLSFFIVDQISQFPDNKFGVVEIIVIVFESLVSTTYNSFFDNDVYFAISQGAYPDLAALQLETLLIYKMLQPLHLLHALAS